MSRGNPFVERAVSVLNSKFASFAETDVGDSLSWDEISLVIRVPSHVVTSVSILRSQHIVEAYIQFFSEIPS